MKKLNSLRKMVIATAFLAACFSGAALADEWTAGEWFEQTCRLLAKANWTPENYAIEEYTGEYDPLISKYKVRSDEGFFDLTTARDGTPERFAFQMKADEPLETQIGTILKAVFPDEEGAEKFAEQLADTYSASTANPKQKGYKPYANGYYHEKRCELDEGWLYVWTNLPERDS